MATAPSFSTAVERRPLTHRPHRPWLAAVLSFIFPGLGQAYARRPRTAAIFAIPVVLLITAALVLFGLLGEILRNALLSNSFLLGVLGLNALLFAWRVIAISDAGLSRPRVVRRGDRRERRVAISAVAALLLATLAMHGWVAVVVAQLDDTLTQVFAQEPGPLAPGDPAGEDGGSDGEDGEPIAPAYRWDGRERINFLLLGTDAAPGRDQILTDVILAVSVDPVERTAAILSVPRDTGFLPLPDESIFPGGIFPAKANELASAAAADPDLWCPDSVLTPVGCGIRTVQQSVGLYMGMEIHYYAVVDMAGFAELVDAVGGVDLCLPGRLVDPLFGGTLSASDGETLILPAGCHRYEGIDALAYARTRQGWIEMDDGSRRYETDFDRNERQQLVLLALRNELADADLVFELPAVLSAIGRTVSSDFPRDQAGDLASLLPLITGPNIERVVLDYPQFVDAPAEPEVNYLLVPRRDSLREEMQRLLGTDELEGWYLGTDAASPDQAEIEGGASHLPPNL